jgi:glucoamylase
MDKTRRIYEKSIDVFEKCSLKNGAILAADVDDSDYPKNAKFYGYVWPRDASYVSVACDLIGLKKIPEKFFEWCWRAESFKEKGVFYMRYHPDGRMYGRQFQPDQLGSVLWAIEHHSKYWDTNKFYDIAEKIADGICSSWNGKYFRMSYDVWEEISSKKGENFTYSIAMCIKGLESAIRLVKQKQLWIETRNQMKREIEQCYDKRLHCFVRKFNGQKDSLIDSSVLGLSWPTEIIKPNDYRMISTVNTIVKTNTIENGGIARYKGDKYAGYLRKKESGAWPILNFWLSIYYSRIGNRNQAEKYFNWVVDRVDEKLPEQIKNNRPASIIPLAWSHAMFIIAGIYLKLF